MRWSPFFMGFHSLKSVVILSRSPEALAETSRSYDLRTILLIVGEVEEVYVQLSALFVEKGRGLKK